jgi:DNA-binding CsgD family transcriptional regulator
MRILLFACSTIDAKEMLIHSDGVEVAFLPSYDVNDVLAEIAQFKPRLIGCSADYFLASVSGSLSSDPLNSAHGIGTGSHAAQLTTSITPREAKVLAMLVRGTTNNEMAKTLSVSTRTVKRTLNNLFERFDASNRTELSNRTAQLRVLRKHM